MRLNPQQLAAHLERPLLPVYFLTGDEPLQLGEAADALRNAARTQGFTEREILEQESGFDWGQLTAAADNLSLFGDRRLLELRLGSGKIGNDGSKALLAYCARPPEDTLLLIIGPKLERSQTTAKWVKTIEGTGALLQIWPLDRQRLPDWLNRRMRSRGLQPAPGVAQWLAERVEGNLLAAAQEVEKLLLLRGPGPLDLEQLAASVADSARFTVFDLADSALAGDAARCLRILEVLRGEGTADILALWALTKEVRLLAGVAGEAQGGRTAQQALAAQRGIWEKRRPLYAKALRRNSPGDWYRLLGLCARADRVVKGLERADSWLLLQDIALKLSGIRLPWPEFRTTRDQVTRPRSA